MRATIIGAGMAGLLAGCMLREQAWLHEASNSLPNNHHALLRFRSNEIANHLNIPFKAVDVIKTVAPFRNKVAEAIAYSVKCNGRASLRSIKAAEGKVERRYIAPSNLIQLMESKLAHEVTYGSSLDRSAIERAAYDGPVISTIPMGALMGILGYKERPSFGYKHGHVVKAGLAIESDMAATIYFPDPETDVTRATLTGHQMQVELTEDADIERWNSERVMEYVLPHFGLERTPYTAMMVPQRYAKIAAIPDRERKRFIIWATDNFNVYSLGRFATWKPGLLMDDVFLDCRKIMEMIRDGHNYNGRLPTATN